MTSVDLIVSYIDDEAEFDEVWNSGAFQLFQEFSELFGVGLSREETKVVLDEQIENAPALGTFEENLPRVKELLDSIEENKIPWVQIIEEELGRVIPEGDTADIPIYPVPNDFYGFGLPDGVCINVNDPLLFENPREFLYFSIHEATHTFYTRVHGTPSVQDLETPTDKVSFFNTLIHTEGYAVYTPLELRENENAVNLEHLTSLDTPSTESVQDYVAILNDVHMTGVVEGYDSLRDELDSAPEWDQQELLQRTMMAEERFPYRVGGRLVKEIEEEYGLEEVHEAFYMDADEFVDTYDHLLDDLR